MEKKLKMYLSFPITGRNIKDVKVYAKRIKKTWEDKGYEVVNPFEVTEHFNGVKEGMVTMLIVWENVLRLC